MPPPRCACGAARTPLATAALRSSWEEVLGLKWSWVTPSAAYWHMCLGCHQARWPGDGRVRNRYCRPRSSDPRRRVGARARLVVGELYLTEPPPELGSATAPERDAADSDSSDESASRSRSFFRLPPRPPRSPRLRPHVPPPQGWPCGTPLSLIAEPCDGWSCAFCTEMREFRYSRHMRGLRVPSLRSSTRNPEHVSVGRVAWMADEERMAFDGSRAVCFLGTLGPVSLGVIFKPVFRACFRTLVLRFVRCLPDQPHVPASLHASRWFTQCMHVADVSGNKESVAFICLRATRVSCVSIYRLPQLLLRPSPAQGNSLCA